MPKELSLNQSILHFDVIICNTIDQSNNAVSIEGFSLADNKANNKHLPKPFFSHTKIALPGKIVPVLNSSNCNLIIPNLRKVVDVYKLHNTVRLREPHKI